MDKSNKIALTEVVYYILLSLYNPLHGYGIMQNITKLTNGRLNLGAGTLYGALNTLSDKKWIVAIEDDAIDRKKMYLITELGDNAVKNEIIRLQELIDNGKIILEENNGKNN